MIKVKLDSDFNDFYDHFFDLGAEYVLHRRMDSGPNRLEMLKILNMAGFKTPIYGMVSELYKDLSSQFDGGKDTIKKIGYDKAIEVVVYTDITSHAGEGKLKMSLEEARNKYPGHLAMQFIPSDTRSFQSRTERLLVVGSTNIWMEYTSSNDWRSNAGNVNITFIDAVPMTNWRGVQLPLYAIDFVTNGRDRLAIDLNVSPGMRGTPVQDKFRPEEIVNLIKDRMTDLYGVQRF